MGENDGALAAKKRYETKAILPLFALFTSFSALQSDDSNFSFFCHGTASKGISSTLNGL